MSYKLASSGLGMTEEVVLTELSSVSSVHKTLASGRDPELLQVMDVRVF